METNGCVENSPAEKAPFSISWAGWKIMGSVTVSTELLLSAGLDRGFSGSVSQEQSAPAMSRWTCTLYS